MTRAQRLSVSLGLLITAAVLHFSACDWSARTGAGITRDGGMIFGRVTLLSGVTRMTNRYGVQPHVSIVLGLAIPLLLLTGSAYVMLGWRRSARLERGLCPSCGYPVGTSSKCSECGTDIRPVGSVA